MKCRKCKYENPNHAKFCMECAYPLQISKKNNFIDYTCPNSYTPHFLAEKILTLRSAIEGERKRVTVFFADVAGFTSISEKLDPEEVHEIMDGCFKILMDEIHNHQGTINQFTGDGIMALFGAPIAIENHAHNACQASLSIQSAIKSYSKVLAKKFGVNFKLRIGLNSGPVIVGTIGDDLRMDYTAIGDTVNLAARMERSSEPGKILVSLNTYERVKNRFSFKALGKMAIKGKEDPLDVYELLGPIREPDADMNRQIFSEMVGRDNELNKLELQIAKAVNGEGSIVSVIGEAGLGKSRLLAELRNHKVMKRISLLEGRAIAIGRNLSFHPIISLLKYWAKIEDTDTSVFAKVKLETAIKSLCPEDINEIFPFVATLMGMKLSGRYAERVKGIEGESLEKLIFKNMRELLIKLTELTPLAVVLEDMHWADSSSVELLEALFPLVQTHRILFINLFRPNHPETGDRIIESIIKNLPVYYVGIHLQPLNEQMSEMLINNILNIKGFQHTVVKQIIHRAGGNPFFIEEVVRSLIDEGALIKTNGDFKVTEKIDKMMIPYTINDVLTARIDRLAEDTRELIKIASVIGRSFFYRILTEVAKTVNGIENRLSYLKQIELIREQRRMEEQEYLFKHALAQEVAYESILLQKRKDLHLQVARAIEKIFDERLHEFYGMLAMHYIKGEDDEKAAYYLIKAGEEAMKASASNEALNYYQEGLKLYVQAHKNTSDPEQLAMFEKNIAIALYNKCRWEESVEHFDKVFAYWKIIVNPNKLIAIILFVKNIILILAGMDAFFRKRKPFPTQRDNDYFDLVYKEGTALILYDLFQMTFTILYGFNRAIKIDMTKSSAAINAYSGIAGTIAYGGLSFKVAWKLLKISKSAIDDQDIQSFMPYLTHKILTKFCAGDFDNVSFEEITIDEAIKKGDLWNTTCYMYYFICIKIYNGQFIEAERGIEKMSAIYTIYNYDFAIVMTTFAKIRLFKKRKQFHEMLAEAERGTFLSVKYSTEIHREIFYCWKAQSQIFLNNVEGAKESLQHSRKLLKQRQFMPPDFILPYLISQFEIDLHLLKDAILEKKEANLSNLKRNARQSGKMALKKSKKYAPKLAEINFMLGKYYWIIGKQKKALKWWEKSVKAGEAFGLRPDLSRTYFEICRRLLEPTCKYKELNGISAHEYLKKAWKLFKDMDLQRDLDQLEKVMAA